MTTERICSQILRKLKESGNVDYEIRSSIDLLESYLEETQEYNRNEYKQELLKEALEANCDKFKLIAYIPQDFRSIFEWCDEAYNFGYMCSVSGVEKACYDKRTYSLKELDAVIDRALSWLEGVKEHNRFYNIQLNLLTIR